MTEKLKRGFKAFREPLRDVSALGGVWHVVSQVWPWIGGGVTMLWSWFARESAVTIWVYSLVALVALVYLRNGLHSWRTERRAITARPKVEPLAQQQIADDRAFFIGRWRAEIDGRDPSITFTMLLRSDGTAQRNMGVLTDGIWEYVNGEAIARWNDQERWVDVLRCTPKGVMKLAFYGGLSAPLPRNTAKAVRDA